MHHGEGLRRLLALSGAPADDSDSLIRALSEDYTIARVSEAELAMLDYAAKLTLTPGDVIVSDVNVLKAHEFDDRAIHDICAITAYFAFVNRIADGLGVDLEDS